MAKHSRRSLGKLIAAMVSAGALPTAAGCKESLAAPTIGCVSLGVDVQIEPSDDFFGRLTATMREAFPEVSAP
jgi:hypothetical protein